VHSIVDGPEVAVLLDELTTLVGREDPYPRYERSSGPSTGRWW
jgi:hypothetical protein